MKHYKKTSLDFLKLVYLDLMKGASLMKKTLSAKVAIIFLPAIVIFLGIIFVILSAWRNSTSIATEQKNLHLVAVGVESYLQGKDLDSITKENCMEQGKIDLYNALFSLGQKANVNDIYIMRKTDESLQIIVDTQDDPAVESDRDELFVDYSDAPEELLSAIESDQENFTKKAYSYYCYVVLSC